MCALPLDASRLAWVAGESGTRAGDFIFICVKLFRDHMEEETGEARGREMAPSLTLLAVSVALIPSFLRRLAEHMQNVMPNVDDLTILSPFLQHPDTCNPFSLNVTAPSN